MGIDIHNLNNTPGIEEKAKAIQLRIDAVIHAVKQQYGQDEVTLITMSIGNRKGDRKIQNTVLCNIDDAHPLGIVMDNIALNMVRMIEAHVTPANRKEAIESFVTMIMDRV